MTLRFKPALLLLPFALASVFGGCANINDVGLSALPSTVSAYAIVDEQLVQGDIVLLPDHTGTITLQAQILASDPSGQAVQARDRNGPPLLSRCVGRLRYTGSTAGSIDLRCNDGAVASLNVAFLGETTAYGYGYTGTGLASLVFGMGADAARAHLTVPPNRQLHLRVDPAGLELQ